jgi:hypothetical protein
VTTTADEVWRRRWWALGMAAAPAAVLPLVIGHRGAHVALNLLLPGARLFGERAARHRPAAWWTILGIRTGAAAQWEHVVATGVARALGPVGDDEWPALRRRALGAAARGAADAHDERVSAGARLWLADVDDQAAPIIARPTVRHDPLATAVDHLALQLAAAPDLPRPPSAVAGAR